MPRWLMNPSISGPQTRQWLRYQLPELSAGPNLTNQMMKNKDLVLEPPPALPKVQRQPKKGAPIQSRRTLKKGRIRSSAIAYVSPCRTKGRRHLWRVRYSRNGVSFDRSWESRLLCSWIACQIHELASPELAGKHEVVDDIFLFANEPGPDQIGRLWIHDTDEPTIVTVNTWKFDALNIPWFQVRGHPWFVSPVVSLDKSKKVQITWRNLGEEVHPLHMDVLQMETPAYRNKRDQIVLHWEMDNLFRINPSKR